MSKYEKKYYVASKRENRRLFHRPSCPYANGELGILTPERGCPAFVDRDEAIDNGYKPCKTCCA